MSTLDRHPDDELFPPHLDSASFLEVYEPLVIPKSVREQHTYVLGRTGTGKTTFLAQLALEDISRGEGLLVIDPHGDLVEDIIDHCPEAHRERIVYLDPSDREHPIPMNIFECKPGQDKDTICSEVIGIFKRLYGTMWGPQLEDLLRSLTLAMLDHQFLTTDSYRGRAVPAEHRYNATLKEAHDFLFNQELRKAYYPFISNDMVRSAFTDMYDNIGTLRGRDLVTLQQVKYSSSTTNKLRRFLLNPLVFDICCNRLHQNTIDMRTIIDERKILLVNLSKGRIGEDNSALLGLLILSRLVVAALSRADTPTQERRANSFNVIVDEFQAFATDSFMLLLTEARKYGITLTIAHQHREQLDYEAKGATLSCGSLVCFRLTGQDAQVAAREFDTAPPLSGRRWAQVLTGLNGWYGQMILDNSPELADIMKRLDDIYEYREFLANLPVALRDRLKGFELTGFFYEQPSGTKVLDPQYEQGDRERQMQELERQLKDVVADHEQRRVKIAALDRQMQALVVLLAEKGVFASQPVRREGSYAEREREIANALTQLPNYTAMIRLVDGTQARVLTQPLPIETNNRGQKLQSVRDLSASKYAVPSDQRPSKIYATWVGDVRREEAYEAELDEQP